MENFRVWLQSSDYCYFLLVDGADNAQWLTDQLAGAFVFRTAQPLRHDANSSLCTFQVPRSPLLSLKKLQTLLAGMPEVTLLNVATIS